jgi:aarF domain-containing kinase
VKANRFCHKREILTCLDGRRSLDHALATTHSAVCLLCRILCCDAYWRCFSQVRIFLITAKYCTYAVWQDDRKRIIDKMREHGLLSFGVMEYFACWWYVVPLRFDVLVANGCMHEGDFKRRIGRW